jgi:D-tyrosyl-tRNA(Tyr) deacylase
MRVVLQRVARAEVRVDGEVIGRIGQGAVLLVGIEVGDTESDVDVGAAKITKLRFFPGATPMDRTLAEVSGACLVISQFTLAGSVRKGNRPSFTGAEEPVRAEALYQRFAAQLATSGLPVQTGRFGADMQVELVNDGPVTLLLRVLEGAVLGAERL